MLNLIGDFSLDNPEEKSNFACKSYQDKLYLALVNYHDQELYCELKILVFDHLNLEWSELQKQQIKVESKLDNCQLKIFSTLNQGDGLIFVWRYGDRFLVLKLEDEQQITEITVHNSSLNLLFEALPIIGSKHLLWRITGKQEIEIIEIDDLFNFKINKIGLSNDWGKNKFQDSKLVLYHNHFYLGANDVQQGFSLWKLEQDSQSWQSILSKGAYRYSLNQKIFGMTVFKDDLYIISGLDLGKQNWENNKFYPSGFEVTRIYEDHDWDIIIGTPQFSPQGLKVPLSALGSGCNDPYNCLVETVIINNNCLYLLSRNIDSLKLWQSENGEDWQSLSFEYDIKNYTQLTITEVFSFSWGIVLLFEVIDVSLKNGIQIILYQEK